MTSSAVKRPVTRIRCCNLAPSAARVILISTGMTGSELSSFNTLSKCFDIIIKSQYYDSISLMDTVRWKLRDFLEQNNLTTYALVRASDLAPNTVYSLARGATKHVRLDTIAGVLGGLRRLTGHEVSLSDILEHEVAPGPEVMDEETRAWLDAALAPETEPYEWGDVDPEALGEPLHFDAEKGWVESDLYPLSRSHS